MLNHSNFEYEKYACTLQFDGGMSKHHALTSRVAEGKLMSLR